MVRGVPCAERDRPEPATGPCALALFAALALAGPLVAGSARAITLDEVLARCEAEHPDLLAAAHRVDALAARGRQAASIPNPSLNVEVENVLGSGAFERDESAETTVYLTQHLELGGKRGARGRLGALEADLAASEVVLMRRRVRSEVRAAFAALLAAQERVALAEELAAGLETLEPGVPAASPALGAARADIGRETLRLRSARLRLALASGLAAESIPHAEGDLGAVAPPPRLESILDARDASDAAAMWEALLDVREAALHHQRTRQVPDVALSAGYRHFNQDDDGAAIFYLSVPLPLFDRNQGELEAAGRELAEARLRRRSAEVRWQVEVIDAHEQLTSAFAALEALAPESGAAGSGPATSADRRVEALVLRTDQRRTRIDALERVHRARATLDGLAGLPETRD